MKKGKYNISYFICPECGNTLPLPRLESSKRNKGHKKHLYCVYCDKTVQTTEIRSGDCYIQEDTNVIYV